MLRLTIRHELHFGDRVVKCFRDRPAALGELLPATLAAQPAAAAVAFGQTRLSYQELDASVNQFADQLACLGLQRGERLALLLGNCPEFLIAVLAAVRLGVIVVPLSIRLQTRELGELLADCGASVLLHAAELKARLPQSTELPQKLRCVAIADSDPHQIPLRLADLPGGDRVVPQARADEHDVAMILYTSGTTGRPKGAMLTHVGIIHSLLHYQQELGLRADDRTLLCVPANHVTGLIAQLLSTLWVGGCTVLMAQFTAAEFLRLMHRERVTYTLMVPAMYNLCLLQDDFDQRPLPDWRLGGYGGAPMPEATIDALAARLPGLRLFNAYGATETTSPATLMPPGETAARGDSVGRAVPCAEIRVMDTHGREVATGEAGEVWIKGPMVVPGYWQNPEATAAGFCAGYWRSGDIGALGSDGYLRVFDRLKDMINRGGYKIYSAEVENILSHHPQVIESALVAEPDPVLGEKSHAYIYLRAPNVVHGDEIKQFCAARLADYKIPDFITFTERPLPRNAAGKIVKRQLRTGTTSP